MFPLCSTNVIQRPNDVDITSSTSFEFLLSYLDITRMQRTNALIKNWYISYIFKIHLEQLNEAAKHQKNAGVDQRKTNTEKALLLQHYVNQEHVPGTYFLFGEVEGTFWYRSRDLQRCAFPLKHSQAILTISVIQATLTLTTTAEQLKFLCS